MLPSMVTHNHVGFGASEKRTRCPKDGKMHGEVLGRRLFYVTIHEVGWEDAIQDFGPDSEDGSPLLRREIQPEDVAG